MLDFGTVLAMTLTFVFGVAVGCAGMLLSKAARAQARQNTGEALVSRALGRLTSGAGCHLLNNITIPYLDGTTQIDHIVLTRHGIFVIETKHYTGWIFGDARSTQWTQVVYQKKSAFQNPVHQNAKHVRAVRGLLEFLPPEWIRSVVVFTGDAEFKTALPKEVLKLHGLVDHINSHCGDSVLSLETLQRCIGCIEYARRAITGQTDVEHQAYLERKYRRAI